MSILSSVVAFEGTDAGFFLKPVTENPAITALGFDVIDDAVNNQYIYHNTELDKITRAKTGCGHTDATDAATITRKQIAPVKLEAYKEQCADVFDNTIFAAARNAGVDMMNLVDSQLIGLLRDFAEPVVSRDALRVLLLGDTGLADANYSMLDGFYAKLAAGVTSGDINDAGAIVDADLTTANIVATLKNVWDNQTRKLKGIPRANKAWYVTDSVYEAWQDYLEENNNLESARQQLITGQDVLTFKGIQMIPLGIVDEYLEADFSTGSPSAVTNPHRVVLSEKLNNHLVLDTVSGWNEVKFWYSDDDDLNKFKVNYQMQYEYSYGDLVVIGGF